MYAGREVFPNAALELVAAEIRFTYVPALTRDEARGSFADALKDVAPVASLEEIGVLTVSNADAHHDTRKLFRLLNREKTLSIILEPNRLVVETTDYVDFAAFSEIVARAIQALVGKHNIAGVERVGLRYIDEICLPSPAQTAQDWRGWVDEKLLCALNIRPDPAEMMQSVIQYSTGPDRHLRFRFGTVRGKSIVRGSGVLRPRRDRDPGTYFLLDFDSYWQAPDTIPPFEYDRLVEILRKLHAPTGETFVASITEKLKNEVLRRSTSND